MAAPLSVCTKEEQRSVIRFLWSEGVSGAETHRRLSAQYGNRVLPQRSVYEWIEKLKNGRTNIAHEEGARRPSTATTDDNNERICDVVLKLVQQWKKCVEKQEDCVEKLCYYKFSIFVEIKIVSVLRIIIDSPTYISRRFIPRGYLIAVLTIMFQVQTKIERDKKFHF
jgi:hypothetical protein